MNDAAKSSTRGDVARRVLVAAIERLGDAWPEPDYRSEAALTRDLEKLAHLFGVDRMSVAALAGDQDSVVAYYTETERQYSRVHSPEGAVHFGLDRDERFRHDGFFEQARHVETVLRARHATAVLELGSGKGFNSIFLAGRNPAVKFAGVDLTPLHVGIARERGAGLSNLTFHEGDFNDLSAFGDGSFDIVFDVEAGCYSDTPERLGRLFSEAHRVLRPGGRFIVYGCYRADDFASYGASARAAAELVERVCVLEAFHERSAWEGAALRAGFVKERGEDLRHEVMPSIRRLHRRARLYYAIQPLQRWMFETPRSKNAIQVMMLPYALQLGSLEYRLTTFEKPASSKA